MDVAKKKKQPPVPSFVLRGHTSSVYCCAFSDDGSLVASGSEDGNLLIWNWQTKRCDIRYVGVSNKGISKAEFDPWDRNVLWTQGRDGFLKRFDLETQNCISSHEVGCRGFVGMSVAYLNQNCFAAVPDPNDLNGVVLLSLDHREKNVSVVKQWEGEKSDGVCLKLKCFSKNDSIHVFCGYEAGNVVLRSTGKDEELLRSKLTENLFPITAVDFREDFGVFGGSEKSLFSFRLKEEEKEELQFYEKCLEIPNKGVNDVVIREDMKVFASAGWDGRVRLFSVKEKNQRMLCVCNFHTLPVSCIAFRKNSKEMICGSNDGKISIWEVC